MSYIKIKLHMYITYKRLRKHYIDQIQVFHQACICFDLWHQLLVSAKKKTLLYSLQSASSEDWKLMKCKNPQTSWPLRRHSKDPLYPKARTNPQFIGNSYSHLEVDWAQSLETNQINLRQGVFYSSTDFHYERTDWSKPTFWFCHRLIAEYPYL